MGEPYTTPMAAGSGSSSGSARSGGGASGEHRGDARTHSRTSFASLVPELQADLYRRVGAVALVYAGAWLANYVFVRIVFAAVMTPDRMRFMNIVTPVCMGLAIGAYVLCRTRRIPTRHFASFTVAIEILGAIGIMAGFFGWEHFAARLLGSVAAIVGPNADAATVMAALEASKVRLLYHEGVPWVAIWMLTYSLVVPAPMGRTILAALLTSATVPAALLVSVLVNGLPANVRPWLLLYGVEATAQTLICAGIAIAGSRVVYQLTRDLSQARRMGSYELVERIGAGGMGEVWKAKHRMLVRPAAIKFIRPAALGDDGTVLRRFEREAQATSRLSSPHSVDLYDFGIADDGTLYYVMELLQGVDLKSIVERFGPMPPERTIHILRQVCHSLADAHQTGLVHRDIKPSNIYVCRSGNEYDFVKVLDFGLVKYVGAETGAIEVTMEGIASGTPGYMAPEMLSDSRHVDARSDLYALGCVAYWLLTGAIVFQGESALAILLRHAKDEPPPPSSRTTQRIPGDLERFVLDCLQKAPEQRPQTATEASRRLAECARSLPSWTDERAEQWWRAHLPQFVDTEYDAHAGEPGR